MPTRAPCASVVIGGSVSHTSIELTICSVAIHALSQVSDKPVYIEEVLSGKPTLQN
jgi:hypothetical protein